MAKTVLTIEVEQESDARFIAEVLELPGVLVYGTSRDDALRRVVALALSVLSERIEHGDPLPEGLGDVRALQERLFSLGTR